MNIEVLHCSGIFRLWLGFREKTNEKIRILEEKLNYVGTYALDAICLLDVV